MTAADPRAEARVLFTEWTAMMRAVDADTVTDVPTLVASNRALSLNNERLTRENAELRMQNDGLRGDLEYIERQTRRMAWIATNVAGRVQETRRKPLLWKRS